MSTLAATNIWYRPPYRPQPVLAGLTLSLEMDQITVLVGESGTGKTTLGMLLAGGLEPDRGEISIDGKPIDYPPDQIGFLSQNPENQIIGTTVEKDVVYGLENRGIPIPVMEKKARETMQMFRLQTVRQRPVNELSGGEMQRTALAGLVATESRYLILDEPTSFLDVPGQNVLYQIVRHIRSLGIGLLWITQYPEESSLGDRVIELGQDGIVRDEPIPYIMPDPVEGTPAEYFQPEPSPNIASTILSVPNLNYQYPVNSSADFVLIVRDYTLKAGERQGWYGYSGSGKSTFAKIIAGILTPLSGTIQCSIEQTGIIYVPQFAEHLLYNGTLEESLPLFRERDGFNEQAYRDRLREELEGMDIDTDEPFHRPIWNFSGGEQRRIALAVAAAFDPDLLILDEPTIGISPGDRSKIQKLFSSRKLRTLICISHEYEFIRRLSQQGVYFHDGTVSGPLPWKSLEQGFTYLTKSRVPNYRSSIQPPYQPL